MGIYIVSVLYAITLLGGYGIIYVMDQSHDTELLLLYIWWVSLVYGMVWCLLDPNIRRLVHAAIWPGINLCILGYVGLSATLKVITKYGMVTLAPYMALQLALIIACCFLVGFLLLLNSSAHKNV